MKFSTHLILGIVMLLVFAESNTCTAADETRWEVGLRGGYTFINKGKNFEQTSAYLMYDLPWSWKITEGLVLGTRGEVAAGVVGGSDEAGFIGSIGPDIYLEMADIVRLHGGVHPTVLSEKNYRSRQFGGPIQFISHGGLSVRISKHINVGYRYQHMSNANIYFYNPGLNLHLLEIGYRF